MNTLLYSLQNYDYSAKSAIVLGLFKENFIHTACSILFCTFAEQK